MRYLKIIPLIRLYMLETHIHASAGYSDLLDRSGLKYDNLLTDVYIYCVAF